MIRPALLASALIASLIGCGDDGGPAADAAPIADARHLADAATVACADAAGCADQPYQTVCDLDRAVCVECTTTADCERPSALGPTCNLDDSTCRCTADADCAGNDHGSVCLGSARACGCITSDDCAEGLDCTLTPYLGAGMRTCQEPLNP